MATRAVAAVQLVRMTVPAGKASPSPPVGPALGQKGVKAMDFCKVFNDRTRHFVQGTPVGVDVYIKPDKTFTMTIKGPSTAHLLKAATGITHGVLLDRKGNIFVNESKKASKSSAAARPTARPELSAKHLYELARVKKATSENLAIHSIEQVCRMAKGTADRLGILVVP